MHSMKNCVLAAALLTMVFGASHLRDPSRATSAVLAPTHDHNPDTVVTPSSRHEHTSGLLTASTQRSPSTGHQLPIAVRGEETPERIPDRLAYYHFVRAVAIETFNPPAEALARRAAVLKQVGLSADDQAALISAVIGLKDELDRIRSMRQATADTATLAQLRQEEAQSMDFGIARLETNLSSNGRSKVITHLRQQIKPNMVVYGDEPLQ